MSKRFFGPGKPVTRRSFVQGAVGAATAGLRVLYLVPSSVFGASAPSNRIAMGCIGVGGMGANDMREFMSYEDVQIVAVCDVVEGSREYGHWYRNGWKGNYLGRVPAQKIVEDHYGRKNGTGSYNGCGAYVDFRQVLRRDDIDAVMAISAAERGARAFDGNRRGLWIQSEQT